MPNSAFWNVYKWPIQRSPFVSSRAIANHQLARLHVSSIRQKSKTIQTKPLQFLRSTPLCCNCRSDTLVIPIPRIHICEVQPSMLAILGGVKVLLLVSQNGTVRAGIRWTQQDEAALNLVIIQNILASLLNLTGLQTGGARSAGPCWDNANQGWREPSGLQMVLDNVKNLIDNHTNHRARAWRVPTAPAKGWQIDVCTLGRV